MLRHDIVRRSLSLGSTRIAPISHFVLQPRVDAIDAEGNSASLHCSH